MGPFGANRVIPEKEENRGQIKGQKRRVKNEGGALVIESVQVDEC